MTQGRALWCAACGRMREASEFIAFWPVGSPHDRRYVCRPTLNEPGRFGSPCFREAIGSAERHTIGAAA